MANTSKGGVEAVPPAIENESNPALESSATQSQRSKSTESENFSVFDQSSSDSNPHTPIMDLNFLVEFIYKINSESILFCRVVQTDSASIVGYLDLARLITERGKRWYANGDKVPQCIKVQWENTPAWKGALPETCLARMSHQELMETWRQMALRGWKDRLVAVFDPRRRLAFDQYSCECSGKLSGGDDYYD